MSPILRKHLFRYALGVLTVALATGASVMIQRYTRGRVPFTALFPAIIVCTLYLGTGPGIVAVALSSIALPLFLWRSDEIPWHGDIASFISFVIFMLVASLLVLICRNTVLARRQTDAANLATRETELQTWAKTQELEAVLKIVPAAVFIAQDPLCLTVTGSTFMYEMLEMPEGSNVSQSNSLTKPTHFTVTRPDGTAITGYEMPLQLSAREGKGQQHVRFDIHFSDKRHKSLFGNARPLFDAEGRTRGAIGAFVDVTSVIESERIAHRANERFRVMADSAPVLVWISDAKQNALWFNKGWLDFTGRSLEEEIRLGWTDGIHPDDLDRCTEMFNSHFERREPFYTEYRRLNKDGEYRWLLVQSLPLREGADGEFSGFIGSCTDINDRRRAEEQKAALHEAEHAARLEAERIGRMKDEFLATLSHELRTPLSAILGWSQLLSQTPSNPEQTQQGLEAIARNAKAQTRMIEDLLDMSRIISGKIRLATKCINPADFVNAAIESTQLAADNKNVLLIRRFEPSVGQVLGDSGRLQQVVWNLLTNAIKFCPHGGQVEIIVREDKTHVIIQVRDNGVGIQAGFLPHVFDRFRQDDGSTTRKHGGLGLGLSIVKQLVELHSGTVHAESEGEGKGATITVSLPRAPADRTPEVDPSSKSNGTHEPMEQVVRKLDGVRVLLVEDDSDTRQVIELMLLHAGARVSVADTAFRGMELLQSDQPHLIISDIGMPNLDGYEFMRRVRSLPPNQGGLTPSLALTAFARSEDRQRALATGFHLHLAKPVEPIELIAACISLLADAKRASAVR